MIYLTTSLFNFLYPDAYFTRYNDLQQFAQIVSKLDAILRHTSVLVVMPTVNNPADYYDVAVTMQLQIGQITIIIKFTSDTEGRRKKFISVSTYVSTHC